MQKNDFKNQTNVFEEVINIFNENKVLPYIIVIGSWAEHIYAENNITLSRPILKTQDCDILIPNINKPREKIDIINVLEAKGFEMRRSVNGLMKFDKENILDIEFIVREIGKGQVEPYHVPSLNVVAPGLRNMEILTQNTIVAKVNNNDVHIPTPAAYILHKLVINENRQSQYKKEKDIEAIRNVYFSVNDKQKMRQELQKVFTGLTKKQKQKIYEASKKYEISLELQKEYSLKITNEGMER